MGKALALHTSDRGCFKRCRRKWGLSSPLRRNLRKISQASAPLWFGSGGHFALEDFHGLNAFKHPVDAFLAYVAAFDETNLELDPEVVEEHRLLGINILNHYIEFWETREKFETLWLPDEDGKLVPQVEVPLTLELPGITVKTLNPETGLYEDGPLYYHLTLDKIVTDENGDWWLADYKFVKSVDKAKVYNDPQISAYIWAAEQALDHDIAGLIYIQIAKKEVKHLRGTKTGLSSDKRQNTTYKIAKEDLTKEYGEKIPSKYTEFLELLKMQETYEDDGFIRFDKAIRTEFQKETTFQHIMEEAREMTNDNLALYPNPTRDCSWDCPFRTVCLAMEEQADFEYLLAENFELRNETMEGEEEEWRMRIRNNLVDQQPQQQPQTT